MRTIVTNIYTYPELPTAKAKAKARAWWIAVDVSSPTWIAEHGKSAQAAAAAINGAAFKGAAYLAETRERFSKAEATGYCGDCILADLIDAMPDKVPTLTDVRHAYAKGWRDEMASRKEREYVEECIMSNEYEFLESGEFFKEGLTS